MEKILYILLFIPALFFCSSEKQEVSCEKPVTEKSVMYTPSELALLMKDMYKVYEEWKKQIEQGEVPKKLPANNKNIVSAQSSNKRANTDFYKSMALTYLNNAESVTQADKTNVKAKFNGMLNTCISCHEQICKGPISRIKKLYIK